MTETVDTYRGPLAVERDVPLDALHPGDVVLGVANAEDPLRTVYRVTHPLGEHHVPSEGRLGRFVDMFTRAISTTDREVGVLVKDMAQGRPDPGMFVVEDTPVLDRVVGGL